MRLYGLRATSAEGSEKAASASLSGNVVDGWPPLATVATLIHIEQRVNFTSVPLGKTLANIGHGGQIRRKEEVAAPLGTPAAFLVSGTRDRGGSHEATHAF